MKERILLLALFCLLGAGACFFAYKNGPLPLNNKSNVSQPPPGWTPAPAPSPFVPPNTTPPNPAPPAPKQSVPPQQKPG